MSHAVPLSLSLLLEFPGGHGERDAFGCPKQNKTNLLFMFRISELRHAEISIPPGLHISTRMFVCQNGLVE